MKVKQLYTNCLAQGAYYIESEGEAAVIDPLREADEYIKIAAKRGAKIKYVFETHFHADFVSGHLDLAKKTGATIVFGPNAKPEYEVRIAKDNEVFKLGNVSIKVLHTPGHTMESSTFLLLNENGTEEAIFSGDTLFLGDVGRPDLAVKSDLTQEDLAGHLYESLRNKILPLPDSVTVYPGHGAGSACGKNMSSDTVDTLGNQKRTNYALQEMSKDEFIAQVTEGLKLPPQYFPKNVALNKKGYTSFDEVMASGLKALTVDDINQAVAKGAIILDTRPEQVFNKSFIKGAINIPLGGQYAVWAGTLITDINQSIVLITEEGAEEESVLRLARVGYDNVIGYLKGGFAAWENETESIKSISADAFASLYEKEKIEILDVRKNNEYLSEHVKGAINFPLDFINEHIDELDKNKTYYVHCKGGYRSMIASSILKKQGYKIIDIAGGFDIIKNTSISCTEYVCPSEL